MEVAEALLAQRPTPEHPSGAANAPQLAREPTTPAMPDLLSAEAPQPLLERAANATPVTNR